MLKTVPRTTMHERTNEAIIMKNKIKRLVYLFIFDRLDIIIIRTNERTTTLVVLFIYLERFIFSESSSVSLLFYLKN